MERSLTRLLVCLMIVGTVSCTHTTCRRKNDGILNQKVVSPEEALQPSPLSSETLRIWVYKYDSSVQCNSHGIELDAMARELAPIQIFASEKRNDSLLRAQVCGLASGIANVYQIPKGDLEKAQKLGFKVWDF